MLAGMDWSRHRPWLVVIESTMPGVPTPNYEGWEPYLLAQGYEFAYFDGVNRFYVAAEHAELKAHFSLPPNVWDDFKSHELVSAQNALQSHEEKLNSMADWMTLSAERHRQQGMSPRAARTRHRRHDLHTGCRLARNASMPSPASGSIMLRAITSPAQA